MRSLLLAALSGLLSLSLLEASPAPLATVKTDNPRATMQSFMEAMNDYKEGIDTGNDRLKSRINDALRCLNLQDYTPLTRLQEGEDIAILLKEVLDRVIVVDYQKIPDDPQYGPWRLKDTEIWITPVEEGDQKGRYLFSKDTCASVADWYARVKELPYLEGTTGGAGYQPPWIERAVPAWSRETFAGIAYWQWIGLFCSILFGLCLRAIVQGIGRVIKGLARHTDNTWDDLLIASLSAPVALLAASLLWWGSLHLLRFNGIALTLLAGATKILFFAALIWGFYRAADVFSQYLKDLARKTTNPLDDQIVKLISRTLKVFVVVVGVLVAAQNMGIQVFSLLAGLGIGGLAVALAAKDSLANFFGSVMIMLDRPFRVGHWILVKGQEGTVEDIGFRSTKIRTFYNSLISIPNSEVAINPVDNMGARVYRRVKTTIGITYDTPPEKLEAFLEGIKNAIKANPHTRKDYFHVVFNDFGPSSLDILLYFFLKVPDWSAELVERQNVLLEIVRVAKELGVDFAFPTQTIHVENLPGHEAFQRHHAVSEEELAAEAKAFGPGGKASRPAGSGLFTPPYRDPDLVSNGNGGTSKEGSDG